MWELRKKSARGRISLRRFSLVAIAMLMAMFVLTSILSPQALAADATRDGDNVTYDGRTYNPMSNAQRPSGIQSDVTGYASIDQENKKAHFIFTTGDPSKATSGQYVVYDFTPPDNFSNSSPPVTVAIANASTASPDTPAGGDSSSCNAQTLAGIGWILCPVVNFLASGMDHLYDVLTGFLVVQPARATDDSALFKMWGVVRNIANICFVIAFLFVIYSQVTSIGISNYGIKKIMPRLIIAAVLVNISFWICAIGIDLSNTLGYGLHALFMNVFGSLNSADAYQNLTWSNVSASLLSGTAVAALGAYGVYSVGVAGAGLLITFIPTLVGVLLSVLVALLVISVRQALIVCLVIISPLAFVAFLLPNTEKWFTKWRELFMTLLLVYPIFSVVFGGAQLAGMAIIQNAGGSLNLIILGMAVQVAPVVITPLLVKVSGSLVGKIAALANNPRQNITGKTRTWAEGRAAEAKARSLATGRANRLTQAIDSQRRWREGSRKNWEEAADHRFEGTERGHALETFRRTNANTKKEVDNAYARTQMGMALERRSMGLDVDKTNIQSDMMDTDEGRALEARTRLAQVRKTDVENNFEGTTVGGQVEEARREADRRKQTIAAGHEHEWHFRNEHDAGSQEREMQLRTATDRAATSKLKVDTTYGQLKAGQAPVGASAAMNALATEAYEISRGSNLETSRQGQAEHIRQEKVNQEMLKNTVTVDGQTIVEYAAGIGKSDTVLAHAIAKQRKDFDEASSAQSELMKHFKINAPEVMNLSMGVTSISKKDDHGNTHVFDVSDDATREAAIEMAFTVGSHNDKKKLVMSSGAKKDASGAVIPGTEGVNYANRATIQAMVIKSQYGGMAPGVNDKALNDILNGDFDGEASWKYHNAREIAEGRIKASTLARTNQDSLKTLFAANDPTDPEFQAARARLESEGLLDAFNENYDALKDMVIQVLKTPTIRQEASREATQVMLDFVKDVYQDRTQRKPNP